MAKANSQTLYRTIFLVLFVVFLVSLESAAKHYKTVADGKAKKGKKKCQFVFSFSLFSPFFRHYTGMKCRCLSDGNPLSNQ